MDELTDRGGQPIGRVAADAALLRWPVAEAGSPAAGARASCRAVTADTLSRREPLSDR